MSRTGRLLVGLRWGGAALAAWGLDRHSPLAAGDPFAGTLAVLPLLLAALYEIGRAAPRFRAATASGWWERGAFAALVLLVLARAHLGLPLAAELLAGGLLLVLAARVGRLVLGLRPLLGRRLPDRPAWPFFVLPLAVYVAILPWSNAHRPPDGDEPYYLLVTHSLAYDLDSELTNNYRAGDWRGFLDRPLTPQPGDPVGPHGELYSRHNLLLPLCLAPAYRLAGLPGALFAMAALTAALAWMTLRLGRHYCRERPGEALVAWGLVAFASPLLLYSYQVWIEVPAALLGALAIDEIRSLGTDRSWSVRRWLGIALPLLLLPLLKIRLVLLAVPLLGLAWWRAGRPRKPLVILAALLAVLSAGILIYNQLLYHNPLKIHTWGELGLLDMPLGDYLKGGSGLFFDGAFGLLPTAPIWLLLLPAFVILVARRNPLPVDLAVYALPYLVIVVSRREWYGGWSPPFRYALVVLPLLALALVPALAERRRAGARALFAGLAVVTLALGLLWLVVPGWTYNLADGRNHLLNLLEARTGADVARLVPSSVRSRPATWLVPFVALAAAWGLWRWPRRRWAGAGALGGGLALVGAALFLLAAHRLPTGRIELEDPWIAKHGGHLHPDPWIIERTRYRGGWVLREGERLEVPVVAGGRNLRLRLELQWVRNTDAPIGLEVRVGERAIGFWTPTTPRRWEKLDFGPLPWRAGDRLTLAVLGGPNAPPLNGLIFDRARLRWE